MQNDFLRCFFGTQLGRIDYNFSIFRFFIRVRNAGKLLKSTRASFGVQTLAIALLAGFYWRRDMHQDEAANRFDHAAYSFASCVIGSNRSADRDAAVLCDLGGYVSDAPDVDVAMLLRKTQFRGQMLAHQVTIEQRDRTSASL